MNTSAQMETSACDKELHFKARGKLLLTGEYLVLHGARALALPLNKGQRMKVAYPAQSKGFLQWTALLPEGTWFTAEYDDQLQVRSSSEAAAAVRLQDLLQEAVAQGGPEVLERLKGARVTTQLEFDPRWGWGSSSTLLSLLGQWLHIDPHPLLRSTFGGSGYDLACAQNQQALFFQSRGEHPPEITLVDFAPPFIDQLYLLWLEKKQTSATEVKAFLQKGGDYREAIEEVNALGLAMLQAQNVGDFGRLLQQHERLLAKILGRPTVQERLFSDFGGQIKSLGAWGGDFVLVSASQSQDDLRTYFATKGFHTLLPLQSVLV